jgi:hypothetical protein
MFWPLSRRNDSVTVGRVGPLWLQRYRIPVSERDTHLYAIGNTKGGKSKFLEHLIVSDIKSGRGVGLVDPHHDLARDTLLHLISDGFFRDPEALERVIYFDPTRTDYVIPFNILKLPYEPYTVATQVIEAFRRTWPRSLEEAPRFTSIATFALMALIETEQSLVEMSLLLEDKAYREEILARVTTQDIVAFFHNRFDKWGRETPIFIDSVVNKVEAFTANPTLKRVLGAQENKLDFRAIMDGEQVLIVDLGKCDEEETRRLLGSLIVTGIELAARMRKDAALRPPFFFFIDEFQDFSSETLARILSECRKFGLYLHLAHQGLGQLHERITSALGNVGIKAVFLVDREDAELLAKKIFSVDTYAVKHDAATTTQHPLYDPLAEQWEKAIASIQRLTGRFTYLKRRGREATLIRTETIRSYGTAADELEVTLAQLSLVHGLPVSDLQKPASQVHPQDRHVQLVDWEPGGADTMV